jgi:hypothetical protein
MNTFYAEIPMNATDGMKEISHGKLAEAIPGCIKMVGETGFEPATS